jgi:hypothetical protein
MGARSFLSGSGHSLHFGSVSMSGLPPTTTEWRTFENGRNVPFSETHPSALGALLSLQTHIYGLPALDH